MELPIKLHTFLVFYVAGVILLTKSFTFNYIAIHPPLANVTELPTLVSLSIISYRECDNIDFSIF